MLTAISLFVREIAFNLLAFGPGLALCWIWGKAHDARHEKRLRKLPFEPLSKLGKAAQIAAVIGTFTGCYLIAAKAFPGPWLSSD